ncbi:nuclear transport factor 2 family protein [Actinoplanes sp. NPDC048796]|uniref:nuclear transport factor 2 family protein n=1 Tax=unclassified Actinoplanes TaxID=2626549 RepID=UPI0033EA19FE
MNKTIVLDTLAAFVETGDVDVVARALGDDFVHHRPGPVTLSKQEWLAAVRAAREPLKGMEVTVDQVLADGDHVVVHSLRRLPGTGAAIAVVEIWRLAGGLIVEGWEIIEPLDQVGAHLEWWAQPAM